MIPHFDPGFVAMGAFGGLLPDLVRFAKGRQKGFPGWFRLPGYWFGLAALVLLGGLAAWFGQANTWQASIAMGFAGPEVISRLFGSDRAGLRSFGGFAIRRWWTG
jgi:hypothetical protein